MNLKEKISEAIKTALKSGNSEHAGFLRLLMSAFQSREIEKRGKGDVVPLTDEEIEDILRKEAKKRKEAVELFGKGGREDLKAQEEKELGLIEAYLPKAPTEEEVRAVIAALKSEGVTEFPIIMKEAMKRLKGVDGALVARLAKE